MEKLPSTKPIPDAKNAGDRFDRGFFLLLDQVGVNLSSPFFFLPPAPPPPPAIKFSFQAQGKLSEA